MRTDTSFTVTARVKLTATGGTSVQTVVAADGTRISAYQLGYNGSTNKWVFAMMNADVDDTTSATAQSDATAVAGKWVHLAGVFDANTKPESVDRVWRGLRAKRFDLSCLRV